MSPAMRTLEPPPTALVDDAGRVRFGTFSGPIADVNLIDAKPYAWPIPRALRAFRLKEWQAFQLANERYFIVVALFNAKLMALAQVKIYDRELRTKHVFERKLGGWALTAPRNLLDSEMRWSDATASIRFRNHLAADRIELAFDIQASPSMPALVGKVIADASHCQPEIVSIPFADNRGMYSHKGCLALTGELRLGDQPITFTRTDSLLLMDDHKGYYPPVMRWDWVTGGGYDDRGRRIGFNLTRNDSIDPDRYNENCVWIDGRIHLLPAVTFTRKTTETPEVWQVRDRDGDVEVDFEIEVDGRVNVNALIVESRYRGPFGRLRGSVRGPDDKRVSVDGMFGMAEDFYLRC